MRYVLALLLVLCSSVAVADTAWTVTYLTRGEPGSGGFFPSGSYLFLLTPTYIPVYLAAPNPALGGLLDWNLLGIYGQAAMGYGQASVPAGIPPISFPIGRDAAVAVPVPERAILPRVLPKLWGLGLEARITWPFQRATTWLAALILGAPHTATDIDLPSVRVSVVGGCSGLHTLALMLFAAGLIAAVRPRRPYWVYPALAFVAALVAVEANALRVAGIALTLEHLGGIHEWGKDWMQFATTGAALAQLAAVARLCTRPAPPLMGCRPGPLSPAD